MKRLPGLWRLQRKIWVLGENGWELLVDSFHSFIHSCRKILFIIWNLKIYIVVLTVRASWHLFQSDEDVFVKWISLHWLFWEEQVLYVWTETKKVSQEEKSKKGILHYITVCINKSLKKKKRFLLLWRCEGLNSILLPRQGLKK